MYITSFWSGGLYTAIALLWIKEMEIWEYFIFVHFDMTILTTQTYYKIPYPNEGNGFLKVEFYYF